MSSQFYILGLNLERIKQHADFLQPIAEKVEVLEFDWEEPEPTVPIDLNNHPETLSGIEWYFIWWDLHVKFRDKKDQLNYLKTRPLIEPYGIRFISETLGKQNCREKSSWLHDIFPDLRNDEGHILTRTQLHYYYEVRYLYFYVFQIYRGLSSELEMRPPDAKVWKTWHQKAETEAQKQAELSLKMGAKYHDHIHRNQFSEEGSNWMSGWKQSLLSRDDDLFVFYHSF